MGVSLLEIRNLSVGVEDKTILKNISFSIKGGELVSIMGPNGSGKTTLAYAIMGHPKYRVLEGKIFLDGEDITGLDPEERSLKGLFLMFQNPVEVRGLKVLTFLSAIINKREGVEDITSVRSDVAGKLEDLALRVGLSREHLSRDLNVGFSGGEKKRLELLQLFVMEPKFVVFDEPDSGLDVNGVMMLAESIKDLLNRGVGVILITHYTRLINLLSPREIIILRKGRIVARGGLELAKIVEEKGYEAVGGL